MILPSSSNDTCTSTSSSLYLLRLTSNKFTDCLCTTKNNKNKTINSNLKNSGEFIKITKSPCRNPETVTKRGQEHQIAKSVVHVIRPFALFY